MHKALRAGWIVFLAISAQAQLPLTGKDAAFVERLFTQSALNDDLSCSAHTLSPFLDFGFRFEAGYVLSCPFRQFKGDANRLYTFLRITPEDGKSIILADLFYVPGIPPAIRPKVDLKHLHAEAEISGVFAMGEGTYALELLVVDNQLRAFHKSWKTTAAARGKEREAAFALPPNHAGSAMLAGLDAEKAPSKEQSLETPGGLRVTVLLNVSPLWAGGTKLHAWDRAFLLQSLWSLLGDATYSSVRLIAFNLDQQRELFRQDEFRRADFEKLSAALRKLELGKVSYQTLQNQWGWSELLARLVNDEAAAQRRADAIIFLGPHSRIVEKVPPEMLKVEGLPRLFYFEFYPRYGADFPDTLQFLTTACKGTVVRLHTPAEFAEGIRKMQRAMKNTGS